MSQDSEPKCFIIWMSSFNCVNGKYQWKGINRAYNFLFRYLVIISERKMKWNESGFRPLLCTYMRWVGWHCPPDTGFVILALAVWGRTRYLSVTEAPRNTEFYEWMGKKRFCFFQTAETGKRTPNSNVKGSGANHYPRAPALKANVFERYQSHPNTRRSPKVGSMLDQRLSPQVGSTLDQRRARWANIEPTLGERLVFAGQCLYYRKTVWASGITLFIPCNPI